MIVLEIEQGTEEWFKARTGIPTASNFDKVSTTKGEASKQAQKYMYQLAGEKVSGKKENGFQSDAMTLGIELEAEARDLYEILYDITPEQVGFCLSDDKKYGASPDALVGDDGLLEIKCPLASTHVSYLMEEKFPTTYFQQVHGQLLVTGRKWCDFMSYYPGMKPFIIRVDRDEKFLEKLGGLLNTFCEDLDSVIKKISEDKV